MTRSKHAFFIAAFCAVLVFFAAAGFFSASAANGICSDLLGTDSVDSQNYSTWAQPVENYLTATADGWMRVVGGSTTRVEYYAEDFRLTGKKTLAKELPIFGGFYETEAYYFLLTGQTNPSQSKQTEVFRVTKYDKNWKRLGAAGLSDVNTTVPFDAGSARFAACGDYLIIRTCHEMYKSSDGLNHQANVTLELNWKTMRFTDSYVIVMNSSCGYVSHSFNQFVRVENNRIVAVDHGDAHPRSVALIKYNTDCSDGTFAEGYGFCDCYDLKTIGGRTGDNFTGLSVGGFEISSRCYLVAGSSLPSVNYNLKTRNIFLSVMDKNTGRTATKWITAYPEGTESASTPHLIAVGGDRFLLLWSHGETVQYVLLDAAGNTVGQVFEMQGALSDCVPAVKNGYAVWYANSGDEITFYRIAVSDPQNADAATVNIGHRWKTQSLSEKGKGVFVCEKCGLSKTSPVPTQVSFSWIEEDGNTIYIYDSCDTSPKENSEIIYYVRTGASGDVKDPFGGVQVTSSNPGVVRVDERNNRLQFLSAGTATVTARAVFNPSATTSVTFHVQHDLQLTAQQKATLTRDGVRSSRCSLCGKTLTTVYAHPASFRLSKTKYSFSGGKQKPAVTVLDRSGKPIAKENYTVTYKNNSSVGTASAVITFRGNYTGKKVLPFTIVPMKVQDVRVKSAAKKQATVSFAPQNGAQAYQIYYSTQKSGPYKKLAATKNTVFTAKQLKSGSKYYFKVRAYSKIGKDVYYGAFSAVKSAKIK